MPASAVASRTPAMAGIGGNDFGASGETKTVIGSAGSGGSFVVRLCFQALDLRALTQLGDDVGLRLAGNVALDLILQLFERRNRAVALVLGPDDVPAERALDRVGQLTRLEPERRFGELGNHLLLGEI